MVIAITERGFVIVLNVGIFVLLLVLVMEAAGMRRSLRRIEREERALVRGQGKPAPIYGTPLSADSLWQNATDGADPCLSGSMLKLPRARALLSSIFHQRGLRGRTRRVERCAQRAAGAASQRTHFIVRHWHVRQLRKASVASLITWHSKILCPPQRQAVIVCR
jgi:hypothetical protein